MTPTTHPPFTITLEGTCSDRDSHHVLLTVTASDLVRIRRAQAFVTANPGTYAVELWYPIAVHEVTYADDLEQVTDLSRCPRVNAELMTMVVTDTEIFCQYLEKHWDAPYWSTRPLIIEAIADLVESHAGRNPSGGSSHIQHLVPAGGEPG
jgi:hypothetical protein